MKNIVVLVSGGGSNLRAILEKGGGRGVFPGGRITHVVSSNPGVGALVHAKNAGVPSTVIARANYKSNETYTEELTRFLASLSPQPNLVLLAGFMVILDKPFTDAYEILNIHPSLLPRHGGSGMYGLAPHLAVLEAGDEKTGATVHVVTEEVDGGRILAQKEIAVPENCTAEELQLLVMKECEWVIYPQVVEGICDGSIVL